MLSPLLFASCVENDSKGYETETIKNQNLSTKRIYQQADKCYKLNLQKINQKVNTSEYLRVYNNVTVRMQQNRF